MTGLMVLVLVAAIAGWIRDEQCKGRVGTFGVSNFDAHALALFDDHLPMLANQIELSLGNSSALDDGTHNATRTRGADIQAWSPLGGGDLLNPQSQIGGRAHDRLQAMAAEFSLDHASLLLRWVASLPATRVVVGSTKIERLRDAAHACAEPLPRDAWYALWEAAINRFYHIEVEYFAHEFSFVVVKRENTLRIWLNGIRDWAFLPTINSNSFSTF